MIWLYSVLRYVESSEMGPQTRSSASSSPVKTQVSVESLGAHDGSQTLKLIILPKHATSVARFLMLKHPIDGTKRRFYFCPRNGLFELKRVNAPTSSLRSILYTGPNENSVTNIGKLRNIASLKNEEGLDRGPQRPTRAVNIASGYVNKAAELLVATPFDMVFILIPLLNLQKIFAKPNAGIALLTGTCNTSLKMAGLHWKLQRQGSVMLLRKVARKCSD
jgi:hypothetical protein